MERIIFGDFPLTPPPPVFLMSKKYILDKLNVFKKKIYLSTHNLSKSFGNVLVLNIHLVPNFVNISS